MDEVGILDASKAELPAGSAGGVQVTASPNSATVTTTQRENVDFILILLLLGMMFAIGMIVLVKYIWPADQVMFTVMSGLATSFSGSFFTRIQNSKPIVQVSTKAGDQIA